ncbi:MAG: hypothetical protein ACI9BF_000321 [Candidatus Paceibacteria bacterium]|jgi:hypothetical protein
MPDPKRFSLFGLSIVLLYNSYYGRYKKAVIRYHKAQLRELDVNLPLAEDSLELVRLQNEATRKGIDPLDPKYPNFDDGTSEQ